VAHGAGLLDIVFVAEKDRKKLARFLSKWQEGKFWPPDLGVGRGRRLQFEWTGFPLHLDDRLWPDAGRKRRPRRPTTITIELEPAALEFLVPGEPGDSSRRRTSNGKRAPRR
jgi:hypothetical protein